METKLIKSSRYKVAKAPEPLKRIVGEIAHVTEVLRNKTHRAYEVNVRGLIIGFTAAELRVKTFILEKVAEEVIPSQQVVAAQE